MGCRSEAYLYHSGSTGLMKMGKEDVREERDSKDSGVLMVAWIALENSLSKDDGWREVWFSLCRFNKGVQRSAGARCSDRVRV